MAVLLILAAAAGAALYFAPYLPAHIRYLDARITDTFEKDRWSIPARVYARPLEIAHGKDISPEEIEYELQLAGYVASRGEALTQGSYIRKNGSIEVITRPFTFMEGFQKSRHCLISFNRQGNVAEIVDLNTRNILEFLRFDPVTIASFLPENFEDRILLTREDIPDLFLRLLLAVEDQNFYDHYGISLKGIARAMVQNIRAGRTVAGGSTLTQQLVKNHFLSNERTLKRKFNEIIMAVLLERKYSKQDILVAYCNEIFLGQDGKRALHGFSLASQHYFQKNLNQLSLEQMAMLVGMVKGPSYYNPKTNPERTQRRRNIVLQVAFKEKLITSDQYEKARILPVILKEQLLSGINAYPSFIDLVQRRLLQNYARNNLTNDGLLIFTTLDPTTQRIASREFKQSIQQIQEQKKVTALEGAFLISDRITGEILAMSGGKNPSIGSYNRSLDAKRQVGSLIKPAVYLTALENGYTLTTPLSDTGVRITDADTGSHWQPKNYGGREHGSVYLYQALGHSLNLATVRLGMQLGVHSVLNTLHKLGVEEKFPPYPSILLGSEEMSPFTVLQMYQTIASDGFYTPLRVIRDVLDNSGNVIQSNRLTVEQRFKNEDIWLLQYALQQVVEQGTASSLQKFVPGRYHIAGKTGTTNDNRDSWFAGYSGDKIGVVWLGRDDDSSTGLTGSSGAMAAWGNIFSKISITPLDDHPPKGISYRTVSISPWGKSGNSRPVSTHIPYRINENTPIHYQDQEKSLSRDLETMLDSIIKIFQ